MNDESYMKLAVREARKNFKTLAGGPFGACIVSKGRVLAVARNTVLKTNDATAHAEMRAIRLASRKLRTFDLSGCVIYSTTEPCPMCFSAIHWARITKIIYGTQTNDAKKIGFNELNIPDARLISIGKSAITLVPGVCLDECRRLLKDWSNLPQKKFY